MSAIEIGVVFRMTVDTRKEAWIYPKGVSDKPSSQCGWYWHYRASPGCLHGPYASDGEARSAGEQEVYDKGFRREVPRK